MSLNITHDGALDIATGRSRKEVKWKNKELMYSELLALLSVTHRTAETYKEYMAAKKERQDEIKDIGGFVGGYLTGGRRKANSVVHRQLITLDADFATASFWEEFTMLYGCAAAMYSTHKHSPATPRLRLLIPLDRPVMVDEYVAISRRIAGIIGIELFDHTTHQPSRLMYNPSTAKDGEYVFEYQDGEWLSADSVLATYKDWRDSSQWPVSEREGTVLQQAIKKQGDPLEKPGVIGAFCRTYSIAEVIATYLPEVYNECDVDDRYTYAEGSTSGGLVVYEDKYAYSHHGTDPASGKLCNAFDLVRLHRYGLKDEDTRQGTPSNKLPSYAAMVELAAKDTAVRKLLGAEKLADARADFEGIDASGDSEEDIEDDGEWLGEMEVDRKGNYHSTINNVVTILQNDPYIKGRLALNLFEQREVALKDLPWRKLRAGEQYLTDKDDASIRHYIEKTYAISNISKTNDAMAITLAKNGFHPIKNYLSALSWDGEERIDTLLIDYLGAEDNEYTRAVTRKALVAAVARVMRPGCKFDYVLTLVGKQGIGKSSIIKKLGGDWFSDSFSTIQGNQAFEQIQGVWLVEIGELAGLKKAELELIKHFITKQEDRYRVAYGRRTENFPRQCVFFGTTNNRDFLRDPTGNRRFWPVDLHVGAPTKSVFVDLTAAEVGQVWAEAVTLYNRGEALFLTPELEAMAHAVQVEHSEQDERVGLVQRYLDTLLPENWHELGLYERRAWLAGDELQAEGVVERTSVCAAEIWCEVLGGLQKDMTRFNTLDIHDIMRNMEGWELSKTKIKFHTYGVQRGYRKAAKQVQKSGIIHRDLTATYNKN